jgi:predicted PurR-regulated permease PerM
MQPKTIEKYFFLGFLLVVILFVLAIFRPFFSVIILGASLAVVLHPLYVGLKHKLVKGRSWLAALITVLLFIIVLYRSVFGTHWANEHVPRRGVLYRFL